MPSNYKRFKDKSPSSCFACARSEMQLFWRGEKIFVSGRAHAKQLGGVYILHECYNGKNLGAAELAVTKPLFANNTSSQNNMPIQKYKKIKQSCYVPLL